LPAPFPWYRRNPSEVWTKVHWTLPITRTIFRTTGRLVSRPGNNGRDLFGDLVPYGKVWRTGANENTEIQFYQDATIGGKPIKKGTYSLFTIPEKEKWTIILNSDIDHWGAYTYNEKNDVLRVTAKPEMSKDEVDNFTIQFAEDGKNKGNMMMAWGNTQVKVPVEF
jgi:hypothetical protein